MTGTPTTTLAVIPQVLFKSLEACDNEAADPRQRSIACLLDAGLSLAVLKADGLTRRRRAGSVSVERAVEHLGPAALRQLVLGILIQQCSLPAKKESYARLLSIWRHSVKCAFIARRLAQASGMVPAGEAYLAGLVHDMGKLVPLSSGGRGPETQGEAGKSGRAEEKTSRRRHPGIGALIVEQATGSTLLADAVRFHHESMERIRGAFGLVKIVYVANLLSNQANPASVSAVQFGGELCGISKGVLQKALNRAAHDFKDAARFLGVADPAENGLLSGSDGGRKESLRRCYSEIGDRSLLSAGLQSLMCVSPCTEAVLKALADGLKIHFDIHRLMFFLLGDRGEKLHSSALKGCSRVPEDLEISLNKPVEGLVGRCFAEGRVTDSFGFHGRIVSTIADEQILHLLGSEGVCCAPLQQSGRCLGVVVMGGGPEVVRRLRARSGLLRKLTVSAAHFMLESLSGERRRVESDDRKRALLPRRMVHEVNNPLGIIKNYMRLLSLKLPENHPGGEEIKLILEEIDRISLILKKYISIVEPEIQQKKPIDLNRRLGAFLKILEKTLLRPRKILLHMNFAPSLPLLPTDWNALKQIILNLVKNAAEAMPRGGRLFVRTRHVVQDTSRSSPPGVEIIIRDTGPGIDPKLRTRLFEPYVTSRSNGHSGLGLYVVHSLVKALGGKLRLDSRPGKGTAFKIFFPR